MQEKKDVELGIVKKALEFIASKGWIERPILAECPLLIERASGAYGANYTNEHLEILYRGLQMGRNLRSFETMTSEDFLEALRPTSMKEAA